MHKEIAERWCTALRSGEYRQGRGALRPRRGSNEAFCCLGVLTDLYLREHDEDWCSDLSDSEGLPRRVREWAGIGSEFGARGVCKSSERPCLTDLNDGTSRVDAITFSQIADIIEEEAETL